MLADVGEDLFDGVAEGHDAHWHNHIRKHTGAGVPAVADMHCHAARISEVNTVNAG